MNRLDIRKKFFLASAVRQWHRLLRELVESLSMRTRSVIKNCVGVVLRDTVSGHGVMGS